jgi:hypothetical protein
LLFFQTRKVGKYWLRVIIKKKDYIGKYSFNFENNLNTLPVEHFVTVYDKELVAE